MKITLWLLALSGYIMSVNSSLETIVANPGGIGGIFKGPDSETIVHGPDGSKITSQQTGGIVATESKLQPIVVAETIHTQGFISSSLAPPVVSPVFTGVVSQSLGNSVNENWNGGILSPSLATPANLAVPLEGTLAPIAASVTPIPVLSGPAVSPVQPLNLTPIGHGVPLKPVEIIEPDPHIIETEIVDAPAIEPKESTDLIGPSGSISTRGSESIISGPASTTISKPAKILIAAPVLPAVVAIAPPAVRIPVVEVNNELPFKPIVLSSPPIVSSTLSPINQGNVGFSTLAPPVAAVSPLLPVHSLNPSTIHPNVLRNDNGISVATIDDTAYIQSISSTIAPPVVSSQRPTLLTGEQYDDERLPPLIRQPDAANGVLQFENARPEGTALPYLVQHPSVTANGLLLGNQFETNRPQLPPQNGLPLRNPFYGARIDLVSNYQPGVNVVDEGANGIQPSGIPSSTVGPINYQNIPESFLTNEQFELNPALIPQRNIIPPEVGFPKGAIDLGSSVQTTTSQVNGAPHAPGLLSTSNIQRNDKANYQEVEEPQQNLQNGYYHNEILVGNTRLETPSQNNQFVPNIDDRSPVQFTKIPQQIEGTPGRVQDYDDSIAASLWNRYGRKARG